MENVMSLSGPGLVLLALACAATGALAAWLPSRARRDQLEAQRQRMELELRAAQMALHEKEAGFLQERNRIDGEHVAALKLARSAAYEEGRQHGRVEGDKQHLEEIMSLQSAANSRMNAEIDRAISAERARLKADFELQTKLFSVQISPFVCRTRDKKFFSSATHVEIGYQYQLLVNGIPAFDPHSVVMQSETIKEVDKETLNRLLDKATELGKTAIESCLGTGGGKFAILTKAIDKVISKA